MFLKKVIDTKKCVICEHDIAGIVVRCLECRRICAEVEVDKPQMDAGTGCLDVKSPCCGAGVEMLGRRTCGRLCHENYVASLHRQFGEHKQVVNLETGRTHVVPLRWIVENGLQFGDLEKFPVVQ